MSREPHERWAEDLAPYLLGALPVAEAEAMERHVESCEHCRREVEWLTPALQALPESVERFEAPPQLRSRLLAEIEPEAGGERRRQERRGRAKRGKLAELFDAPSSFGLRPAFGLAALLAVVAVAGLLVGGVIGGGEAGGGSSTVVAGAAPGVTAEVVADDDGSGSLHLANVRPLHREHVLEAWVQRDGEVEPVRALFVPDHDGRASTELPDMGGVEVVMVTTEPAGGSDSPTSAPLVTVRMG